MKCSHKQIENNFLIHSIYLLKKIFTFIKKKAAFLVSGIKLETQTITSHFESLDLMPNVVSNVTSNVTILRYDNYRFGFIVEIQVNKCPDVHVCSIREILTTVINRRDREGVLEQRFEYFRNF